MIRIGINGFGRTGRASARIALERNDVKLVAINSRSNAISHAYLLKYDSVHGTFPHQVSLKQSSLIVDGQKISCFQYNSPSEIPWEDEQVDIVIEASGKFKKRTLAAQHLHGSVKKVIVSAPSPDADKTIVIGVNECEYDHKKHHIISNGSCTTNCLAVLCKVIDETFGIKRGFGITVHASTQSQALLDRSHKKDQRRGRTAFLNIIPTTTGAAKAIGLVLPQLTGKLQSFALRVPVGDGSIMIVNIETEQETTKDAVNAVFKKEIMNLKGILAIADDGIVSQDIIGNQSSAVFDPSFTEVVDKNLISVFAWYDNEIGYSTRLIDLAVYIGNKV